MLDPNDLPPIPNDEHLARAIVSSSWLHKADNSLKPSAFMPDPEWEPVSMTRHAGATEEQLWNDCRFVAARRKKILHGRADVLTHVVREQELDVVADPTPDNPNHVVASGWPGDKSAQKLKAMTIANQAKFLATPQAP